MNVGFIGLGKMGMPMARNVLRSGYRLTVFNRSSDAVSKLARLGAVPATSPKEVGSGSDVVLLSLPTPEAVRQVILGVDGVVEGLRTGGVVVDTSTTDPVSERGIERELKRKGFRFLDAPVSGGPEGAKRRTLTFMVGGEKSTFDECAAVLRTMGQNIFYLGRCGAGQGTKLINQILVASHTIITAEAMMFGALLGLNPEETIKVIQVSAGDSFIFRRTAPQMGRDSFGEGWQTYLIHKDLGLILGTAERLKCPMVLTGIARELFSASMNQGSDKTDSASVVKVFEKMARKKVSQWREGRRI